MTVSGATDITHYNNSTINNDRLQLGFNAPEGYLKTKNSSGSPASNLAFYTTDSSGNTNKRMHLSYDGKVGINTTTLTEQLEVDGDIRVRNQVKFRDPNGDETGAIGLNDDDNFTIQSFGTDGHITLDTGSTAAERLRITSSGNIGIGTTNPTVKLVSTGLIKIQGEPTNISNLILQDRIDLGR